MSLLTVNNLEKSFGADTILDGVSLRLGWGQKMGLIGRNGSGKTTLLRILTGQMEADKGRATYARGVSFGYLMQEEAVDPNKTVIEEAQEAFQHVLEMEGRLRELEQALPNMTHGPELDTAMDEYALLHERFDAMNGYSALRDVRKVLMRLGFKENELDKPNSVLSGGERTRLALARLLLLSPDVLFLDEPTNHLDMAATEWLEEFLSSFGGALLLVAHDRYFLDKVVTSIAELEKSQIKVYPGNFSTYWNLKQEQAEHQLEMYERQQEEIARLEEYVRRTMGNQKTGQAKSRLKAIDRIKQEGVDRPREEAPPELKLTKTARSGNDVVLLKDLTKRYGERTLFEKLNLMVRYRDRLGVIGPNGSGKSTLIEILLGREEPTSGIARLGASITMGYFAQDTVDLDPDMTVLDHIYQPFDIKPAEARNFLARFLFTGDDVFRPVALLSGGEKNKLALAQLIMLKPNLLILDEPTNHLDIASREALAKMLREYDGTLILVSHDRYLLDQVTTHTLEFIDGRAELFDGSYAALHLVKEERARKQLALEKKKAKGSPAVTT
ncbi:MAG: ABC-F family ATP-binding cassette domain-containing protein, partial [bacterium]